MAIAAGGIDPKLLAPVHPRTSQINSCSACVYAGVARRRPVTPASGRTT
ncbi:hypothetical protein [Streptomyces niveus]